MFLEAFEKVANINRSAMRGVGQLLGRPVGKIREHGGAVRKKVIEGTKNFASGLKSGMTPNRKGAWNGAKELPANSSGMRMNPGAKLTQRRTEKELATLSKAKPDHPITEKTKEQVHRNVSAQTEKQLHERAAKIDEARAKAKRGPSFAQRHPFITAGGTVLMAKHLLSEKKEESPQPMMPNGY